MRKEKRDAYIAKALRQLLYAAAMPAVPPDPEPRRRIREASRADEQLGDQSSSDKMQAIRGCRRQLRARILDRKMQAQGVLEALPEADMAVDWEDA